MPVFMNTAVHNPNFKVDTYYNPDVNVSTVKFGEGSVVLEVEMNEIQEIQNHHRRDFIRSSIGDGLFGYGNIQFENSRLTITNEKFIVDGDIITVKSLSKVFPNDTAVYINLSETEFKHSDKLKMHGNKDGQDEVENYFFDNRIEKETTRRKIVTYELGTMKSDRSLYLGSISSGEFTPGYRKVTKLNLLDEFMRNYSWNSLPDKPATFPPSTHTHTFNSLQGRPQTYPPSTHTHTRSQISDFPSHMPADGGNSDTVDGRHVDDTKTDTEHLWTSHKVQSVFNTHRHTFDSILDKPETYPATPHNHDSRYYTQSQVNTRLNTKSDTTHLHPQYDNQNAFGRVKVGMALLDAKTPSDMLEIIQGANITLTTDEVNKRLTIQSKDTIYTHPSTHPASIIVEDVSRRFVSDSEKIDWNSKATPSYVDTEVAKLVAQAPLTLNNLQKIASAIGNNPMFAKDTSDKLDTKVDKELGKGLSTNDYTTTEKNKLAGIATNANNYTHPASHPASMITESTTKRFITDAERTAWNNKVDKELGKGLSANDYTDEEKEKLAGVATNANNYVHPGTHAASMITESATRRFVSDTEKATWDNKVDKELGKGLSTNDYTTTEKSKLAGIAVNANNYTHPSTHAASMITESTTKRFVSDAEKAAWSGKAEVSYVDAQIASVSGEPHVNLNTLEKIATSLGNDADFSKTINTKVDTKVDKELGKGLSTNDYTTVEKNKLAGIAVNANNYVHPSSHAASMITESATRRFVSDTEKATWNGKATPAYVDGKISDTVGLAPVELNTLEKIATSLGGDAEFSKTINTKVDTKVDKVTGKGLSTNDYTTAEKNKLAGIEANANNYTHPSTHPASIITESTTRRFVSDTEKATWNAKATEDYVNTKLAELVDTAPETLDTLNELAAALGNDPNFATTITTKIDTKVDKELGKGLSTNDYTTTEKNKLAGIAANANNYTHPTSHPASMITESTTKRFITDVERTTWNNKVDKVTGKGLSTNDYTTAEKNKLAGIATNANNYTHPSAHAASMITESTTRRFVSDAEKATWSGKAEVSYVDGIKTSIVGLAPKELDTLEKIATSLGGDAEFSKTINTKVDTKVDKELGKGLSTNDYTTTEKNKLAGIAANANNYSHPSSHAASMITESTTRRFVSDAEKATWNSKVDSETGKGLSTNDYTTTEKNKLAGIATGANNYTHPTSHAASMITESTTRRFASDAEKATWSGKAEVSYVDDTKTSIVGLAPKELDTLEKIATSLGGDAEFSKTINTKVDTKVDKELGKGLSTNDYTTTEKNKLAGIAANANNYSHPSSHAASMITESTTRRFVSDAEKATWNSKVDSETGKGLSTNDYTTTEKNKLAGIATGANNYTHPSTHAASMITESTTRRFVSDAEKSVWNSKAEVSFVTSEISALKGLAPKDLDTLEGLANAVGNSTTFAKDTNDKLATKVDKEMGKGLSTNDYTTAEKNKLAGIATGANNYIHPTSHAASMITESTTRRFVSDAEKATWNNKSDAHTHPYAPSSHTHDNRYYTESEMDTFLNSKSNTNHTHAAYVNQNAFSSVKVGATTVSSGSATDTLELVAGSNVTITPDALTKKVTIASSDTVYTHPSTHPASMITESTTRRFITDAERASWNARATQSYVDGKIAELIDTAPGTLDTLNELAAALGNDPNFATTVTTKIDSKVDKVTGKGLSTNDYTTTEKNKLAGIATGANNYTLPTASSTVLGGIRLGQGLSVTSAGVVSVTGGVADAVEWANVLNKPTSFTPSAHGNHVPATQTANNATFLRNDNTWQRVTAANIGAEPSFSKNTAFNKNFGTSAGQVSEGNHNHDATYHKKGESNQPSINFEAVHGSGVKFWNSQSYSIYMSGALNGTHGGRPQGDTESDHNMYFRMNQGTSPRGFVFRTESEVLGGIDGYGNIRAKGFVSIGNNKAKMEYNEDTDSIDFMFI